MFSKNFIIFESNILKIQIIINIIIQTFLYNVHRIKIKFYIKNKIFFYQLILHNIFFLLTILLLFIIITTCIK